MTISAKSYVPILEEIIINTMTATGDRIMGSIDKNKNYDAMIFYKCSTDPVHCIKQLNTILLPCIEKLLIDQNKDMQCRF